MAAAMSIRARCERRIGGDDIHFGELESAIDELENLPGNLDLVEFLEEVEDRYVNGAGDPDLRLDEDRAIIVRGHLGSVVARLRRDAARGYDDLGLVWLQLGGTLGEGLCRPDVIQFIDRSYGREILRTDPYTVAQQQEVEQLTSYNVSFEQRPTRTRGLEHVLGFASRRPGDLAPRRGWADDVRRYWALAKVGGNLSVLEQWQSAQGTQGDLSRLLADVVHQLQRAAYAVAMEGPPHFRVDVERRRVELGTEGYDVTPAQAVLFAVLQRHRGRVNHTQFSRIKRDHPSEYGKHDKLDDVLTGLPMTLKQIVKSARGAGTWLELTG